MVMNLLKLLIKIASITIFSRVLGFIRDVVIAKNFGTEIALDAFIIAFKLPNLLRRIFAEGAFYQALMPILAEYKNNNNQEKTCIFLSHISGLMILVLLVISGLGVLFAPWIIIITAPGFVNNNDKFIISCQLLKITFPYILFISLTAFISAILNTWNFFLVPAMSPIFLNITMISFTLFFTQYFKPPILVLAWAVIAGGVIQLIYQICFLKKIGISISPRINLYNIDVIKLIKKMIPAILGVSINQISLVVNSIFSSFMLPGSVSCIYYADRLIEFSSGVLGVTLSTILVSHLSKSFTKNNYNEYSNLMDWGLRVSCMLALPITVTLIILAKPLIISLFQYGKFTASDTLITQKILISYSIGLIGLVVVKILTSGFYSRQDIKTPVKIAFVSFIMNQLMNLVFIRLLNNAGLSFSISLTAYLNSILLYWQLRKQNIFMLQSGWTYFLLRLTIAVFVMSLVLIGALYLISDWALGTMSYRILRLFIVILTAVVVYFIILAILGFKINEFSKTILSNKDSN